MGNYWIMDVSNEAPKNTCTQLGIGIAALRDFH